MNEQATSRPEDPFQGSPPSTEVLLTAEVFDGEPGCIAQARALADRFLARLVAEWLAVLGEHTRSDLMLAVSELITNADRYSHGPYLLELEGDARRISVTVYDSSTALPVLYSPDPARLGGHGMEIVVALCDRLTAERVPVGKRIRAEFMLST
ncbi:ATP-binding protein [Streptomyces sp. NE06-03E]|uniref:ATP-binding protein n=2 Tax=Streptomyces TaxID=1883 RepID=A0A652LC71_9ACTN|nr:MULTISPECIES: ATP-binding protein [Streptomyces]WSS65844.1 ATP-binding protein [Streptomyces sp. NBC_01177]WSS72836.1 ATP-binding protein [Streptomyces sp. NBC_01175]WSS79876.1 ATP-binding protein [Streptomyces sp. NBC_01174]MBL1292029.1 ATP-binding protein [Streptomyces silvae]MDX3056966.1 ATP-binding protein [Streptomyces sp. NE06-03E]